MKTYLLKAGVRNAIAKAGETDIAVAYNAKTWMDEYPAGNPQLMVTTPGGKRVPVTVEAVDNLITGQVPNELLAGPGVYSYVFVWTSGSTQLESGRCECLVLGSNLAQDLVHDSRRTPDWAERIFQAAEVIEGAIPGMMEARNTTADNAAEAKTAAEAAAESESAAADSAEAAAASEENIDTILTNMEQTITDATAAMNGIEEQKNTMIASIASVAGQGTDTTLTQSGVAADAKAAGDQISDLKSALNTIIGCEEIPMVVGKAYNLSQNSAVDINNPNNSPSWTCGYVTCQPGDMFTIYGKGGYSQRLWCFLDSDKIPLNPRADTNKTENGLLLVAPANAAYLCLNNDKTDGRHSYKGITVPTICNELKGEIETISEETEESIDSIDLEINKIKGITIEGYNLKEENVEGTRHNNSHYSGGQIQTISGWTCLEISAEPNTKYKITGTGNPAFVVVDENEETLDGYSPGVYVNIYDYVYMTPENTAKIYVNGNSVIPSVTKVYDYTFIKKREDSQLLGYKVSDGVYEVGKTGFINGAKINGSHNGLFNLDDIYLNGEKFKNAGDDVSPVLLTGAAYVGANHGYNFGYECTSNAHGLVNADIGKTYSDGTNTWVLLKIISEDKFLMVCYESTKWYRVKTATVPGSVNFGSSLTISASSLVQILPSVKNGFVRVAENTEKCFRVIESYDIIDLGTAVDAIIANVGNNTNDSVVERADAVLHLNTVYEFTEYGSVTIYQQLIKLKEIGIDSYYGSQCMAFAATDLFAVLGTSFPTLQTAIKSATKETWSDQNKAPCVFIKSNANKSKGFLIAYLMDRTADIIRTGTAGYMQDNSGKVYPTMIQPSGTAIKTYENIILRMPFVKNASGADYVATAKVGNDIYVFIGLLTAKTEDVTVDAGIYGKSVEVIDSNNITISTETVVSTIKVTSTGEGYCLLRVH